MKKIVIRMDLSRRRDACCMNRIHALPLMEKGIILIWETACIGCSNSGAGR